MNWGFLEKKVENLYKKVKLLWLKISIIRINKRSTKENIKNKEFKKKKQEEKL